MTSPRNARMSGYVCDDSRFVTTSNDSSSNGRFSASPTSKRSAGRTMRVATERDGFRREVDTGGRGTELLGEERRGAAAAATDIERVAPLQLGVAHELEREADRVAVGYVLGHLRPGLVAVALTDVAVVQEERRLSHAGCREPPADVVVELAVARPWRGRPGPRSGRWRSGRSASAVGGRDRGRRRRPRRRRRR